MDSKSIEINPYQSVNYLFETARMLSDSPVRLYLNGEELVESSESLLSFLHEKAIIHVVPVEE